MRALILIALAVAPASATAQIYQRPAAPTERTEERRLYGGESSTKLADIERREVVSKFANCIVRRRHDEVAGVILNDETNREILQRHRRLIDGDCLKTTSGGWLEARFPGDTLRYALAEALVRTDFATSFPPGITSTAPLSHHEVDAEWFTPPPGKKLKPKDLAELERRKNDTYAFAYLTQFGECVVRADPLMAHRLLLTRALTDDETIAFKSLAPKLSGCLGAGATFKANKATMRGTIAHNFYRLAKAPRLPFPGVTH